MSLYIKPEDAAIYRLKAKAIIKHYNLQNRSRLYRYLIDRVFARMVEKELQKNPHLSKATVSRIILAGVKA